MAASTPDPRPRHNRDLSGVLSGVRIYAQLKPDGAGLDRLLRLQAAVRERVPRTRPVSSGRLHLTLIHFGKADEAYDRLAEATGVSRGVFGQALAEYLDGSEAALPAQDYVLYPRGLAGFGRTGSTLALEFDPTPDLQAVHEALYGLLLLFLGRCGVPDPAAYAAQDPALEFSSTLRPHISILHGFPGTGAGADAPPLPVPDAGPFRLRPLPVLYRA